MSAATYTMSNHHQLPPAGSRTIQGRDPSPRGEAKLQMARSQLRPVSFSSAMTSHSTSSSIASAQTSSSSGNSSETVVPRDIGSTPPRPPRPTARRMQTTPAAMASSYTSDTSRGSFDASAIAEEDEREGSADASTDDEPICEEHVVALHDFTSNNETCLSFKAGQVIKVFNRDESGWWDGELDGERGWFPSNYVDEEGMMVGSPDQGPYAELSSEGSHAEGHTYQMSQASHEAGYRVFALRRSNSGNSSAGASTIRRPHAAGFPDPYRQSGGHGILEPIQHSITLLGNAVQALRWAHFQPATACVISSVRSVLSATDCLTRESETLRAHPVLAKERKQVLSELSRLVTQSRRASAVSADADPSPSDMQDMLRHANNVLLNSRRFIAVAQECGIHIPDGAETTVEERAESDKTPTPGSVRSSFVTARTSTNTNRGSGLGSSSGSHGGRGGRSPLLSPQESSASSSGPSTVGPSQLVGKGKGRLLDAPEDSRRRADSTASAADSSTGAESIASASGRSRHGSDPESVSDESHQQQHMEVQTREEILERLKRAHEHLVSIVAAVVGHAHGHARDAHAASAAFLIDVTRDAVEHVRNLLAIVEPMCDSATIKADLPRERSILEDAKTSFYEATTTLVTAARILTSRKPLAGGSPSLGSEDEEKAKLLAAATALLRTGQECVGAVKMCLSKVEPSFQISLLSLSKAAAARDARAAAVERQEEEELEEEEERSMQEGLIAGHSAMAPASIRRGKNTLSFLGRKATSLSCLRQKYEQDAMAQGEMSDNEDSPWNEHRRPPFTRHALTGPPSSVAMAIDLSGETSDASDAVSRQHSRASGSTMHSLHSSRTDLTADTSSQIHGPPSSVKMDRRGTDASMQSVNAYDERSQATPVLAANRDKPMPPVLSHGKGKSSHASIESIINLPSYEPEDVCFNADGQVMGATLPALVERLTPHDTTVNPALSNAFLLCFRLFTTPRELFDALVHRFSMPTPSEVEADAEAMTKWVSSKVMPVRLRVLNFFKTWLELHWHASTDSVILEPLRDFISSSVTHALQRSGQRLAELVDRRQTLTDSTKATALQAGAARGPGSLKRLVGLDPATQPGLIDVSAMYLPSAFALSKGTGPQPPTILVNKSLMASLRSISPDGSGGPSVLDFDPLELARQLTIMESKIFCCILPDELLARVGKKGSTAPSSAMAGTHIKQMSALTTHITGWITESILSEEDVKRRSQLLKFFIKLGDRCLALQNYNALFAIQGALQASTISRLRKTWGLLATKYLNLAEQQRHVIEHTRNFAAYRSRLRSAMCPALPFLGLFLTDLTFCDEGNADTRPSPLARQSGVNATGKKPPQLVNFDKYAKLSRIVAEVQRFQTPYNLVEVPEIQGWLERVALVKGSNTAGPEDLYGRSLWLEPRAATATTPMGIATLGAAAGVAAAAQVAAANGGGGGGVGTNGVVSSEAASSMGTSAAGGATTLNGGSGNAPRGGLQSLDLFNWAEGRRK